MPNDVKYGIAKTTGSLEVRYEDDMRATIGGAAIIVCMTDNKVRTVAMVRHAFSKHSGNMGTRRKVWRFSSNTPGNDFARQQRGKKGMEVALGQARTMSSAMTTAPLEC
jgi:transcriptional/translational regulatory protein YebC/TACO1